MSKPDDMLDPHVQEAQEIAREADRQLAIRARAGDLSAREALIINHIPLVEKLLVLFRNKGVPEEVLYQEGCYGLILAVDRFDPDKGVLLDTYASYYVNKYLHRALVENYPHPIPLKAKSAMQAKAVKEAVALLTELNGKPPSTQEVADFVGLSYAATHCLLVCSMPTVALDTPDTEEWFAHDVQSRGAEESALRNLNEMYLEDFPATLTSREESILRLYFGFAPETRPHSFSETAKILGLSFDTVSTDYHRAIQKLRDAARPHRPTE